MVLYKSWLKACVVACFTSILFLSCNSGSSTESQENNVQDTADMAMEMKPEETQVYYQVPAPDEMIAFIKEGGFEFNTDVLNPTEHLDQYTDQKSQALNLGFYTADLTYMASYGEFQESGRYFNVIIKLADRLGISSAFDEALVGRVKNNLENSDSLEIITNDSYYSIVDNLEGSNRGKTLAIIAAGGWLESMYIVVNLLDEYKEGEPILDRIADQKLVYENLMLYMAKYENEAAVHSTIEDFKALGSLFENFKESSNASAELSTSGKMKVLGGGAKISITADQFNELKLKVTEMRNGFASISS